MTAMRVKDLIRLHKIKVRDVTIALHSRSNIRFTTTATCIAIRF